MISVRVFVCVIMAVWGLDYVRANNGHKIKWRRTLNFDYKEKDELNIEIILRNLPSTFDNYALFYGSEVGDSSRNIPPDKTIHFTHTLIDENFTLNMLVLEGTKISSNKTMMNGKIADDNNSSEEDDEGQFEAECLNTDNPCRIFVDFGKNGEEVDKEQGPAIKCKEDDNRYTCKATYKNLPQETEHQWDQKHKNGNFIGRIPKVKGKKAIFKFDFQKFDEMSTILYTKVQKNELPHYIEKIFENQKKSTYHNYTITSTAEFSDTKEFHFTCSNLANTQIGLIDPTGYGITTFGQINLTWNFRKMDNGSMLCCLDYNTYSDTRVVERIVRNITLLIYKEAVNHDSGEATKTPEQSSSTTEVTSPTTFHTDSVYAPTTSRAEPTTNTEPAPAQTSTKSPHALTTPEPAGSIEGSSQETHPLNGSPQSSDYTKYYIAMVSTAGAILLVSLIYVLFKKCTRKAQDPEQTLQLETYASTNMVYAELDIRPGKTPAAPTTENTTYAQIIGVLRPQNEYVKK